MIVLITLADEIIITALILLVLWRLNVPLTLPVFILLTFLFLAIFVITYRLVIPAYRRKAKTGREELIGIEGCVTETLEPTGIIKVGCEYWKAKSTEGTIEAGETVQVTDFDGLVLKVRRLASRQNKAYDLM